MCEIQFNMAYSKNITPADYPCSIPFKSADPDFLGFFGGVTFSIFENPFCQKQGRNKKKSKKIQILTQTWVFHNKPVFVSFIKKKAEA